jgi:DNA-binding protein HU-beta
MDMNKNELVEAIALSTEITKTDVDKVVTSLTEVITDELEKGDSVSLKGFGTFEVRSRSERTGRNPRTGETLVIPASKVPAFKVSSALKKAVNK